MRRRPRAPPAARADAAALPRQCRTPHPARPPPQAPAPTERSRTPHPAPQAIARPPRAASVRGRRTLPLPDRAPAPPPAIRPGSPALPSAPARQPAEHANVPGPQRSGDARRPGKRPPTPSRKCGVRTSPRPAASRAPAPCGTVSSSRPAPTIRPKPAPAP